jgi:hypothetical protein
MSWHRFAAADPEFAAFGKERLHDKVAYLATIRADGAPRLHPVRPIVGDNRLFIFIDGMGSAEEPMLEAYSALSYLAGVTTRARHGAMVTAEIYRYPGILVKTVSTLDVLSGGRAYLGIGAGRYEREARGLGLPFPPLKQRLE